MSLSIAQKVASKQSSIKNLSMRMVMTPAPLTIDEDTDLVTARRMLRENQIRHLPVVHAGKLVGVLSARDTYLVSLLPEIGKFKVADIMSRKPSSISEDSSVLDAVATMNEKKHGCIVVTGGKGEIRGIFTAQDALEVLLDSKGIKLENTPAETKVLDVPAPTEYPLIEDEDDDVTDKEECLWD